jgi:dienelactone hydrolase
MSPPRLPLAFLFAGLLVPAAAAEPLPGTQPLAVEGDAAAHMVAGIDTYLDRELAAAVAKRAMSWKPDYSSPEAYARSVAPNRDRLRHILGVVDPRVPIAGVEYVATTGVPALIAEGPEYRIFAVRWPVLEGVDAEGLLLQPKGKPVACVVAIPDADWTPEVLAGLAPGVPRDCPVARTLVGNGCLVLVPTLIDRQDTWSGSPRLGRMTNQPHREFLYRMAYPLGRHVIGYELQKVLAAVDWFTREKDHPPVGVFGYGEGGMLALYAAALDTRIKVALVSGYFGPREGPAREPIYRNVWGVLREFGDAELARLIAPRAFIVESAQSRLVDGSPRVDGPPPPRPDRSGAAPGGLRPPAFESVRQEWGRAEACLGRLKGHRAFLAPGDFGNNNSLQILLRFLTDAPEEPLFPPLKRPGVSPTEARQDFDPVPRQRRQFEQLVTYSQRLMRRSEARRDAFFWSKLDTSSREKYEGSVRPLRAYFWEETIGKLPEPDGPANPRTRLAYDEPNWRGYEVRLDVYSDVFASGVLLVPKDLRPGQRRPVVVCQHGLEGSPDDVVNPRKKTVYNSFGARLADRGYVVYAPLNPYVGGNTFRQLQRKANPLRLTLFAFIVRQHERTLDWLATLPFVDAGRIGFYGLSYGGETAMRVPGLLPRYALSICSGDFNQFTWKTVSLDLPASYVLANTYEIFDFDMGNRFSHAEMAALVAPRPFMVERGHDDGVGVDEWVAYEYAKVRRLYSRLKMPERTEIEFFVGGHEIHGQGTFVFLDRHLGPPR